MIKERNLKYNKIQDMVFYGVMLALPLLQFLLFYVFVNFNSVMLAFKSYVGEDGGIFKIVWFDNIVLVIKDFFTNPVLLYSIKNSFIYYFTELIVGFSLALLFSYYIFKKLPFSNMFRVFLFLPSIISCIVMVILYTYSVELAIPKIVSMIFHVEIKGLLENYNLTFGTIMFYNIWIGFGTSTLLYVGAMNNISESVIESARLEGVGFFNEFFKIVLPLIFPTVITFIMMGIASLFTNQLNLFSFYGELTEYRLSTVGYFMYKETLKASISGYPYLAAMGVVITLVIAPLTLGVKYALEKYGPSVD